jgi:hypothetical protein
MKGIVMGGTLTKDTGFVKKMFLWMGFTTKDPVKCFLVSLRISGVSRFSGSRGE